MRSALIWFVVQIGLAASPVSAEMRLLMVEQEGCVYCAEWNRVIAPIYPKSPEGKAAPLERIHIRGPYPEDAALGPRPAFTPTFILVADGREAGRIEGYPGEDFFWGLLANMLEATGKYTREDTE
ncbi:MAG: hypothetical protein R3E44_14545 [Paracoccaceae bacterium]